MHTSRPRIGDIVHFSAGDKYPCRPALVVSVGPTHVLNLNVAQDVWDSSHTWVRAESVRYNEFGGTNTWHFRDECSPGGEDE